jgi:hypothetical protein
MKKYIYYSSFLVLCISFFSCKPKEKLPPAVSSVIDAQKLITGKTWQVIDVATITGSRKSIFDEDKPKTEAIIAPDVVKLNWFSKIKGIDTATDFMGSFYKDNFIKFKKISFAFNKDSIATSTGLDADKQVFSINNTVKENEANGIKLTLTGDSKTFAEMGITKATITYYILGANDNKLYLLTPNEMNNLKVVFLLEAK